MSFINNHIDYIVLGGGIWLLVNGILHDIAVLFQFRGKKYDRELLRLMMDGHILLTNGTILLLSFWGIRNGNIIATYLAIAACVSILIYCAMIFPFLKSVGTISIILFVLASLLLSL